MSLARHTIYNIVGAVVPVAVSLITVPLFLASIGLERYGVLALCWVLLGMSGFVSLGMGPAVAQRIATIAGRPPNEQAEVVWTALVVSALLGSAGGLGTYYVGGAYFASVANHNNSLGSEVAAAMPLLSLIVPLAVIGSVLAGALQGKQQFLRLNIISASASVMMAMFPLLASLIDTSMPMLVATVLAAKVIEITWLASACHIELSMRSPTILDAEAFRNLIRFGGWSSASSILGSVLETIDRFVIGSLSGPGAVAVYAVAFSLVSRIGLLPLSFAKVLLPTSAAAGPSAAGQLEMNSARVVLSVMTPLAVLLLAILGPFMSIWIGASLEVSARPVANILVLGFWLNSVAQVPFVMLQARGRPDLPARLQIVYLLPYLSALYFGVLYYGAVGAAAAWTARSFWDPALFLMTGTARRIFPLIFFCALIVGSALAVAWTCDWRGYFHWILMAALFLVAVFAGYKIAPHAMIYTLASLTKRGYAALAGRSRKY